MRSIRFFFGQLNLGQLQRSWVGALLGSRPGDRDEAEPDAFEITIRLTSATLLLLDELKRKAAAPSRSATIERLILDQAQNDSQLQIESSPAAALHVTRQPLASATFYYQDNGTSRPLEVVVTRDETTFHLTLRDDDAQLDDASFSFTDFAELTRALENARDPRISAQEGRLLLELLSGEGSFRQQFVLPKVPQNQ